MPYKDGNDESLPSNVKKLPADARDQWVKVFNSSFAKCTKEGGDNCDGVAMQTANGVAKKRLWETLEQFAVTPFMEAWHVLRSAFVVERAQSFNQLTESVFAALRERYQAGDIPEGNVVDLYHDAGDMFVLINSAGKLFRMSITANADDSVVLGDLEQVAAEFKPVTRTTVLRTTDGKYRWLSISGTSVLNKDNEIDSRQLFDNFVARAKKTGKYPIRQFFHQGHKFRTGQADYLARDGNVYITSGIFDDSVLARAEVGALQREPEYWGESIGYDPIGGAEMVEVARGVKIPVYRDGVHKEISTLPQQFAASLFTTITVEVTRMNKVVREALDRLFESAGMKPELDAFASAVDDVNRVSESQITREASDATTPPAEPAAPATPVATTPTPEPPKPVEVTDELVDAVLAKLVTRPAIAGLQQTVADLKEATGETMRQVVVLIERQKDAPATSRPRTQPQQQPVPVLQDSDAAAAATLAKLPKRVG